LFTNFLLN